MSTPPTLLGGHGTLYLTFTCVCLHAAALVAVIVVGVAVVISLCVLVLGLVIIRRYTHALPQMEDVGRVGSNFLATLVGWVGFNSTVISWVQRLRACF